LQQAELYAAAHNHPAQLDQLLQNFHKHIVVDSRMRNREKEPKALNFLNLTTGLKVSKFTAVQTWNFHEAF
jgi:hypothetical protein